MDINHYFSALSNFSIGSITLSNLLPALLVLAVCLLAKRMLMKLVDRAIDASRIDLSLRAFLRSAVNIGLLILTALIVADKLGIPVTSLIAALGVAGLAVSLAVQGTLSNIAGGIMLLLSNPFAVGDYIEAGETGGTVREIGLVYTKLATIDNKLISVPNGDIAAAKVVNYSAEPNRRIDLEFGAAYTSPVPAVKAALLAAAARFDAILPEPAPFVNILEYRDSQIAYTLRVWVRTPDYWDVRFALLEAVGEEFDSHGVEMSYPHMNVHIVKP